MYFPPHHITRHLTKALGALLLAACASIGTPDGGPFDETPPQVVGCTPVDKSVGVSDVKRVHIRFDEYIKLENANEKVIISPPQLEMPDVYTSGKQVVVRLYDSLRTNTTYTIDFSDAIVDNNESNPLGNYTYSFSTGTTIDTLQISGHLVNASNLNPLKGVLVGIYPDSLCTDSILLKQPLSRVSRSDDEGRFCIKGVAPGTYRVYAVDDKDGDFHFSQKSELVAFDTLTVTPFCEQTTHSDTLWRTDNVIDTVLVRPSTRFYPDNIVLRGFLEEGQAHNLLKTERREPLSFSIYFTAPSDTFPKLRVLNEGDWGEALIPKRNLTNDTLQYWVADTLLAYQDTLMLEMSYLDTDTAGVLQSRTDTIPLVPKTLRSKQIQNREKQVSEWHKLQCKKLERSNKRFAQLRQKHPDSVFVEPFIDTVRANAPHYTTELKVGLKSGSSMSADQNALLSLSEPMRAIDTSMVHFFIRRDTLWIPKDFVFEADTLDPCLLHLYAEWRPGEKYKLEMDSAACVSVYGHVNRKFESNLNVNSMDVYGALFVHVTTDDTASVVVQLLQQGDKVIYQEVANENGRADFFFVKPGTVFLRCFVDLNGDGKWTTGDYASGRQPEPVYYFPQPFNVRAKWELEQDWDIKSIETLKQKPSELLKQKAKNNRVSAHQRNLERKSNK